MSLEAVQYNREELIASYRKALAEKGPLPITQGEGEAKQVIGHITEIRADGSGKVVGEDGKKWEILLVPTEIDAMGMVVSAHIPEGYEHPLAQKCRLQRIMIRNLGRLIVLRDDWRRASGLSICAKCGLEYYEHPTVKDPVGTVVVTCDGRQWKL